jgi:exopolysaccharide biosynthesis polyprenyl glycosylphosphotransferase
VTPPHAIAQASPNPIVVRNRSRSIGAQLLLPLFDPRSATRRRAVMDALLLYLAAAAALFADAPVRAVPQNRLLVALFPLVVLGLLHARRAPEDRLSGSLIDPALNVLGVVSVASMALLALGSVFGGPSPLGLAIRLWLFSAVYLGGARVMIQWVRREARINGMLATPTLIVGAGTIGVHLARRLETYPSYGLRPVGFLDADPLPSVRRESMRLPVLGGASDLAEAVERTGARHVVLAFSSDPDSTLVDQVRECQRLGVRVSLVPRMFEQVNERSELDHVGGVPLLSLESIDPYGWQFAVKHAMDRGIALLTLVALAPLMLSIALLVKLSSTGPVLFRQRRVGRDGHEFDVLKFRTMRVMEDGLEFVLPVGVAPGGVEGVDRRTTIGRMLRASSLDELPQLLNVLRGDMSLVGPRPERPEFVRRFEQDVQRYGDRHRVKSGITGWAQVNGLRGQTSIADRVEWDNHYIQNWSLWLDVKILLLTIGEVLRFRDSQKMRKYPLGRQRRDRQVV